MGLVSICSKYFVASLLNYLKTIILSFPLLLLKQKKYEI